MDYLKAQHLFQNMQDFNQNDQDLMYLYNEFLNDAVSYARIRVEYHRSPMAQREEINNARTKLHNALIASMNSFARHMKEKGNDISWQEELGDDRKDIGDIACFIHCQLGIDAR